MVSTASRIWRARALPSSIQRVRSLSHRPPYEPPRPPPVRDETLPPFDHDARTKHTDAPDPRWSWCQKVDRVWTAGEKHGWKTVCTADEDPNALYALLISGVVPRPIALVSTVSKEGVENLAPFSWFGMISHRPPIVGFACLDATPGQLKDTAANVQHAGFVVHIVSEPLVQNANATSIDAPRGQDEWALSGLTKMPSTLVKAPRIKESAFSMEHELYQTVPIVDPEGVTTTLVLAHVRYVHIRNDVLGPRGTVDVTKLRPVARLGDNLYARVGDVFRLPRPWWGVDGPVVREALASTQPGAKPGVNEKD